MQTAPRSERPVAAPFVVGDYDESTACLACWERGGACRLPCCQRMLCVDCLLKIDKRKCPYKCNGVLDKAKLFADAGIPQPMTHTEPEWLGREYFEGVHDIDSVINKTEEAVRFGASRNGLWTHHWCRHCQTENADMYWGMGEHDVNASSRTTCGDCLNEKELLAICFNNCVAVLDLVEVFANARKKTFNGQVDAVGKFVTMRTPGAFRRLQIKACSTDSVPRVPTSESCSRQHTQIIGMPGATTRPGVPRQSQTMEQRSHQQSQIVGMHCKPITPGAPGQSHSREFFSDDDNDDAGLSDEDALQQATFASMMVTVGGTCQQWAGAITSKIYTRPR